MPWAQSNLFSAVRVAAIAVFCLLCLLWTHHDRVLSAYHRTSPPVIEAPMPYIPDQFHQHRPQHSSRVLPIVTLATTHSRYTGSNDGLLISLNSLLAQARHLDHIRVHFPVREQLQLQARLGGRKDKGKLAALLRHPKVKIVFADDIGPASKFIYTIEKLIRKGDLDRPVIVVDDDKQYHKTLLETLMRYASMPEFENTALGIRGWRVHSTLQWKFDVPPDTRHVLFGWELDEPVEVSVITGVAGYLVKPRFFGQNVKEARRNLLDLQRLSSTAARLVDDIWMSGNLARNRIKRYLVPISPDAEPPRLKIPSRLKVTIVKSGVTRAKANDATLRMFREAWEADGIWQDADKDWWKPALRETVVGEETEPLSEIPEPSGIDGPQV